MRRFRPPLRDVWFFPLVLTVGIGVFLFLIGHPVPFEPRDDDADRGITFHDLWLGALVLSGLWVVSTAWGSIVDCTAFVDLDADGIAWRDRAGRHRVRWVEVLRLGSGGPGRHPTLALELRNGGRPLLPFVSRSLYRALGAKLGRLPEPVEKGMGLG